MSSKPIGERILKAGASVLVAHICFKAVGFIQFFVVGGIIPTQKWETVYGFAFEGVLFSIFLIGEEMIGPAFLPVFISEKENNSEEAAWELANSLLACQILILTLLVSLLMIFPGEITQLITYWKPGQKTDYYKLAVESVRFMAPALIGFSVGSTTYMLLNGYKKFFLAAFGDAVWKACVLVSVLIGAGIFGLSWKALAFGIIIGSIAKLLTHLLGLLKQLKFFKLQFKVTSPAFKSLLWLMLPLFVGIVFAKARDFYNQITVFTSLEMNGLIKANAYGRKLFQALGVIVPYTLSIAMFPFFCELASQKDHKKLGEILTKSSYMLLVFFIPIAIICTAYSHSLVKLLVWGKFSSMDADLASFSMAIYTLVLPAYAMEMLLMQAFFANRRMVSVTIIGIVFSGFSILFSYIGIIHLKATGVYALLIVSGGYVISRSLKTLTLMALLKQTIPLLPFKSTTVFLTKVILISLAATVAVWWTFYLFDNILPNEKKLFLMIKLVLGFGVASVTYVVGIFILKVQEPFEMLRWAKEKVKNRTRKVTPNS